MDGTVEYEDRLGVEGALKEHLVAMCVILMEKIPCTGLIATRGKGMSRKRPKTYM